MLFARLVLIAVQGEHDGLEESVDFGQADEATKRGDVPRLALKQEEKVRVLLEGRDALGGDRRRRSAGGSRDVGSCLFPRKPDQNFAHLLTTVV